jgi:hypothetical protein
VHGTHGDRRPSSGREVKVLGFVSMILVVMATFGADSGVAAARGQGPFEGETTATQGHGATGHSHFVLGDEELVNQGQSRATISSISIIGAKNMKLVRAFVTRVPSKGPVTLMGVVNGMPPEFFAKGQAHLWKTRVKAAGAHVGSTSAGWDRNMLIVVRSLNAKKKCSLDHLRVRYHVGTHQYVWNGKLSYVITP